MSKALCFARRYPSFLPSLLPSLPPSLPPYMGGAVVVAVGRAPLQAHDGIHVQMARAVEEVGLEGGREGGRERRMREEDVVKVWREGGREGGRERGMREDNVVKVWREGGREGGKGYLSWLQHGLQVRHIHLDKGHEAEGKPKAGKEGVAV